MADLVGVPTLSEEEKDLLAYTVLGEAANQGKTGREAVAWVIRNRAESGRFPNNPAAVAMQKNHNGVYQFSTWNPKHLGGNDPIGKYSKSSAAFKSARQAIEDVFGGAVPDPTKGAQFYYAPASVAKQPYWFDKEAVAGATDIGGHRFASKYVTTADVPLPQARPGNPEHIIAFSINPDGTAVDPANDAYNFGPGRNIDRTPLAHVSGPTTRKVQVLKVGPDGQPIVKMPTLSDTQIAVNKLAAVKRAQLVDAKMPKARDDEWSKPAPQTRYGTTDPLSIFYQPPKQQTLTLHAPPSQSKNVITASPVPNIPQPKAATIAKNEDKLPIGEPLAPHVGATPQQQAVIDGGYYALHPSESPNAVIEDSKRAQIEARKLPDATQSFPVLQPGQVSPETLPPQSVAPKTAVITSAPRSAPNPRVELAPANNNQPAVQTVRIASGKTVQVGATGTAQGGRYQYQVQSDGSVKNLTTGRTTAPATK